MKIFYLILFFQALALSSASGETLVIRVGYDKGGMPINDHYVKKTVTFQTSEDLFAKIRATDFQKALFYLGFNPEFFEALDDYRLETDYRDNFNEVPFDEDMLKPAKIRDAQKAYEYAAREVARGGYRKCFMAVPLLAVMHLQGIGTPKNIPKAVELLRGHDFFEFAKDYFDARERFPQLIAYLYYRGIGVEKNEAKAREILKRHARFHKKAWRNFYCGYIAPKDFEFSVFILENIGEAWAANALADIYSGKYSLADADDKKRDMWRVRAKVLSSKDKTK